MPELPEVETIRRQIAPRLTQQVLTTIETSTSPKFVTANEALGRTVLGLRRSGKYLIASLTDGKEMVIHLGMTGSLRVIDEIDEADPYTRVRAQLCSGATLVFRDVRQFGRVMVVDTGAYTSMPTLANLGPDALSEAFTGDHLWHALRSSRRHLKTQLLSQRPVAGIGNIYADEALWRARVHPRDTRLSRPRAHDLRDHLVDVLTESINRGGTTIRDYVNANGTTGENQDYLACYGRSGTPCQRCQTALVRIVVDARSTTLCPTCQPRRR